jgi:hypothetical protein
MIFDLLHFEFQPKWRIYSISIGNIEFPTQYCSLLEISYAQDEWQGDFLYLRALLRKLLT